jgi:hypothetical protein
MRSRIAIVTLLLPPTGKYECDESKQRIATPENETTQHYVAEENVTVM